jgi:hypothetical protein
MTPAEHRRAAQRLRREYPRDPEAHGSATAHEQIAETLEFAKADRVDLWWILFLVLAIVGIYVGAYLRLF